MIDDQRDASSTTNDAQTETAIPLKGTAVHACLLDVALQV
jgi:hypothetical protein